MVPALPPALEQAGTAIPPQVPGLRLKPQCRRRFVNTALVPLGKSARTRADHPLTLCRGVAKLQRWRWRWRCCGAERRVALRVNAKRPASGLTLGLKRTAGTMAKRLRRSEEGRGGKEC